MSISVSFIIPAYRSATTLGRTLHSICRQTERNWEAIVVDDGSDDRTVEVAQNWCARDPRFQLIAGEHGGASRARNRGIALAQGEWIVFLDADDTIDRGYLKAMLRVARRKRGADVVACGYRRLDARGRVSARIAPLPLEDQPALVCASGPPGAIHSFLVRKSCITDAGGFDERLSTSEDWDLWLRIALNGAQFAVTERRLVSYWSSPQSLTRSGLRMLDDSRVVMERARSLHLKVEPGYEMFDHSGHSIDDIALRNAFWNAGVAIGQGDSAVPLVDRVPPTALIGGQITHLVEKLMDGLVVGAGVRMSQLIDRWDNLQQPLEDFVDAVVARIGGGNRTAVLTLIQVLLARHGHFRGTVRMLNVEAVSLKPTHFLAGYQPGPDIDSLVVRIPLLRPSTYFSYVAPVFGRLSGPDIVRTILRGAMRRLSMRLHNDPDRAERIAPLWRGFALIRRALGLARSMPPGFPMLSAAVPAVRTASDGAASVVASAIQPRPPEPPAAPVEHPGTGSSAEAWDQFFGTEDPWNYGSAYEQLKYRRTLDLIPRNPSARALELACAEGRFTELLAPTVATLLAADISEIAIERARRRTRDLNNISFVQHDLFGVALPRGFDLITCSEVLYFAPSEERLAWLVGEVAEALNVGGYFAHAHAYELTDDRGRTGFDWDDTVGAAGIHAAFAADPRLSHRRTVQTELYRIDLFERVAPGSITEPAVVEDVPIGAPIEPDVAGSIVWGGAIRTRSEVAARRAYHLPVLKLNAVGIEALEPMLRFARRRGFSSVTPDELDRGAARAGSLRGRPLMLVAHAQTVERDAAVWEIVRQNGFGLHLFVETDAADWGWLAVAVKQGLTIGSGLASGIPADDLTNEVLLEEAIRSRLLLERLTGGSVTTVAPPWGQSDPRVEQMLAASGYHRLFVPGAQRAPVCGNEMIWPMMRVKADAALTDCAAMLGPDVEAPDAVDLSNG